ncbi:MAG: dihydroneopterin aldolase [Gemmatimonadota bacterium]|nr:dihydroneopterin aldolase [Gemmatimonadota bacterium]
MTGLPGPHTLRNVSTPSEACRTEVALIGMRFHTCVGVLPHERILAQPLEVDLIVRHGLSTAEVLDYRALYEVTRATIDAGPLTFLELIAESLATSALAIHGVAWCRVTIRKPHVALGGPLAHASVSIERSRA